MSWSEERELAAQGTRIRSSSTLGERPRGTHQLRNPRGTPIGQPGELPSSAYRYLHDDYRHPQSSQQDVESYESGHISVRNDHRHSNAPVNQESGSYGMGNVDSYGFPSHSKIANKTLILVSPDSTRYTSVEITGATSAAFIKEKIFTALNVFDDEDQSLFSIYRTEIGQYAIGDALTDDKLFELYLAYGDPKGTLKFLVSHSSADQPAYSFTPPVIPQDIPATSMQAHPRLPQPHRRSRSRHGNGGRAGYDADIDNTDHDNGHPNTGARLPAHRASPSHDSDSWVIVPSESADKAPTSTPQDDSQRFPVTSREVRQRSSSPQPHKGISPYHRAPDVPSPPRIAPPPRVGDTEALGRIAPHSRPQGQTVPTDWKMIYQGWGERRGPPLTVKIGCPSLLPMPSVNSLSTRDDTVSPPSGLSTPPESTLKDERDWLTKFFEPSGGSGTVIPPPRLTTHLRRSLPPIPIAPSPPSSSSTGIMMSMGSVQSGVHSDSDDDGVWNKRPATRSPLTVRVDTISLSSSTKGHPLPIPNANSLSTRDDPVPPPAGTLTPQRRSSASRRDKEARTRERGSTFTAAEDAGWATRPPPEDMYERLEEFFPEHDLDRPVIEAGSGGTLPTAVDLPPVPEPSSGVNARVKGKKSIRYVAQEHKKRIDRISRALVAEEGGTDSGSFATNMLRKRSTKLWGSKLEEVTPSQAKASPSHSDASSSGHTTFKWVRGELLGKGTSGCVYLALNATTIGLMAVKQVDAPRMLSDRNDSRQITVAQALKMESETLKDLDHPNIVQYLGFEETSANLSLFMEYLPGGSIRGVLLKYGKLNEDVTISFTGQVLSGLEYLHSKGILHRDLRADTISVGMDGVCKISDFGISKRIAGGDGAETPMQGTVYWMAPEVINTEGKPYNFKVDIWSLGCVVLEMLTGTRPWTGDEMFAVMFKLYQEKQPPPVPSGVVLSELGDDFLRRKCFAINPDDRPTAAELLKHEYLELPPDWKFSGFPN
ncbi:mitogen-activated protein kinase kinase kinase [Marasmius crinis-equi]|uniref:Mitogen-activated protein kinase kinase kinase n=1 Tax=Marasmius crinis-equi TaxID=585013 RepID=A0ABR3FKI7_9AGAR